MARYFIRHASNSFYPFKCWALWEVVACRLLYIYSTDVKLQIRTQKFSSHDEAIFCLFSFFLFVFFFIVQTTVFYVLKCRVSLIRNRACIRSQLRSTSSAHRTSTQTHGFKQMNSYSIPMSAISFVLVPNTYSSREIFLHKRSGKRSPKYLQCTLYTTRINRMNVLYIIFIRVCLSHCVCLSHFVCLRAMTKLIMKYW